MVSGELVEYVKSQLRNGYRPEDLRQLILRQGWHPAQVDEAFDAAYGRVPAPVFVPAPAPGMPRSPGQQFQQAPAAAQKPAPVAGEKLGLIGKVKKGLTSPAVLAGYAKTEQGIMPALKFFAVFALIEAVIMGLLSSSIIGFFIMFISLAMPSASPVLGMIAPLAGMLAIPVLFFGYIASVFVGSIIQHVFFKLFGAKNGWSETFKAMVYGNVPITVLGWIPLINIIAVPMAIIYLIIAASVLHDISKKRAAAAVLLPPIVILVALQVVAWLFMQSYMSALP